MKRIAYLTASMTLGLVISTSCEIGVARGDGAIDNSAATSALAQASPSESLAAANSADIKTMGVSASSGGLVTGRNATQSAAPVTSGARIEGGQVNGHWREGTRLIDQVGRFRATGDRLSFTSADGALHFDCLENLCGQRVARAVTDSPEPLVWTVAGVLTEFRGTNYLLLTQAVLKPRARGAVHAP